MSYWESNLLSSRYQEKTSYETWNEKKPKVKYFWVFGSKCFILNDRENLGKFDAKSDEGIFLGNSLNSQAYRVFNKRTKTVMESINLVIDDAILEKIIEESMLQILRRMMMMVICLKIVMLKSNHWKRKLLLSHQEEKQGHPKCHQVCSLYQKCNLQYPVMMSPLRQRNHCQE